MADGDKKPWPYTFELGMQMGMSFATAVMLKGETGEDADPKDVSEIVAEMCKGLDDAAITALWGQLLAMPDVQKKLDAEARRSRSAHREVGR